MIRSQQSGDQNQGFFKPQQKVVEFKQNGFNQINKPQNYLGPNQIVGQSRPNDYSARIITNFQQMKQVIDLMNNYPQFIMKDKCRQSGQQLVGLKVPKHKNSKKYLTLQQKYHNNQKYKLIYSKLKNQKQFSDYIFSLQNLTDHNQANYLKAQNQTQGNQSFQKKLSTQDKQVELSSASQNYTGFQFDSNFESGNLNYAFFSNQETQLPSFDLTIQNDTNTNGYNQWFYFSIEKNYQTTKSKTIRINIVNFIKKHLMFEDGVRPVSMYQSEGEWNFIGRQMQYKKSYIKRCFESNGLNLTKNYYTLSFLLDFPESIRQKQKVYIALNYPYPYKRVISMIDRIISQNKFNQIKVQKQTLCHTISNNQIPYVVISSIPKQKQIQHYLKAKLLKTKKLKQKLKHNYLQAQINQILLENQDLPDQEIIKKQILEKRKKILILGRQHPGQTVGSFVLQGFINSLMSGFNQQYSSPNCQNQPNLPKTHSHYNLKLLRQYTIYVFPMINVDGVIYGNFRTNLAGFDLNRQWVNPNRWLQPQIFYLKRFVSSLKNIQFVMDFHGHSRKLNSFIYACNNPVPIIQQTQDQKDYPDISIFRLFPYIFSKQCQLFSIKDCTYTISRDKVKTARINTFKNLNYNPYIFTLETGFYGYTKGQKKFRYKIQDFATIGKGALQSLKTILLKPKKVKDILKEVQSKGYLFDMWSFENKQDLGSQSNPSEDQLDPIQIKAKVLSDIKIRQKQANNRQNQVNRNQESPFKKAVKKHKKRQQYKKAETQLKNQIIIVKDGQQQRKQLQSKINNISDTQKQIRTKNGKNQRSKIIKVEYLNQKKKNVNNQYLFNVVAAKEIKFVKHQFHLPQANYRQKNGKTQKKLIADQMKIKSTSNLLTTETSYLQTRHNKQMGSFLKQNRATLQMLEVNSMRRDVHIQSFSSEPSHEQKKNVKSKFNYNSFLRDNQMKDLFYNINRINQKKKYPYPDTQSRQRLHVVRDKKIVKMVNNVNKIKSLSQKTFLQNNLRSKQDSLKQCQQVMGSYNKGLIDQIKDQIIQEKNRKKKVYLHPIFD